jgi:hypothetical protein
MADTIIPKPKFKIDDLVRIISNSDPLNGSKTHQLAVGSSALIKQLPDKNTPYYEVSQVPKAQLVAEHEIELWHKDNTPFKVNDIIEVVPDGKMDYKNRHYWPSKTRAKIVKIHDYGKDTYSYYCRLISNLDTSYSFQWLKKEQMKLVPFSESVLTSDKLAEKVVNSGNIDKNYKPPTSQEKEMSLKITTTHVVNGQETKNLSPETVAHLITTATDKIEKLSKVKVQTKSIEKLIKDLHQELDTFVKHMDSLETK